MEAKHSTKAIRIRSPSTTIPCSIKGTIIEALHDPTVEASIMFEFLEKKLSWVTCLWPWPIDSSQVPWDLSLNVMGSQQLCLSS
jgi:hypothetical protein